MKFINSHVYVIVTVVTIKLLNNKLLNSFKCVKLHIENQGGGCCYGHVSIIYNILSHDVRSCVCQSILMHICSIFNFSSQSEWKKTVMFIPMSYW